MVFLRDKHGIIQYAVKSVEERTVNMFNTVLLRFILHDSEAFCIWPSETELMWNRGLCPRLEL